jgi:RNA polymerase sigma factor (sigma-70 family)
MAREIEDRFPGGSGGGSTNPLPVNGSGTWIFNCWRPVPECIILSQDIHLPAQTVMNVPETLTPAMKRMEQEALALLHDHFYPVVYRYIAFRLENQQVIEDIASEVFLTFLDILQKKPDSIRNLKGWLLGTASNKINDHLRAKYRRQEEDLESYDQISSGKHLEREVEQKVRLQNVREVMHCLTQDQQQVLVLRFSLELSLEETAQILSKTTGAVKVLQFRALEALRRNIEDQND